MVNFDDEKPGTVKVYDFAIGPFPAIFRIALREKKLYDLVEFQHVDIFHGEQRTNEFLKDKNFLGKIPVLEFADGTILSECIPLMQYIDQLNSDTNLTGYNALERAHIHMMSRKVEWEILFPLDQYFHHATEGLGPELETHQVKEWGNLMLEKAKRQMKQFDAILREQPYFAGDRFTMADCSALGFMVFAELLNISIPDELTGFRAWWERVSERPSVKDQWELSKAVAASKN